MPRKKKGKITYKIPFTTIFFSPLHFSLSSFVCFAFVPCRKVPRTINEMNKRHKHTSQNIHQPSSVWLTCADTLEKGAAFFTSASDTCVHLYHWTLVASFSPFWPYENNSENDFYEFPTNKNYRVVHSVYGDVYNRVQKDIFLLDFNALQNIFMTWHSSI